MSYSRSRSLQFVHHVASILILLSILLLPGQSIAQDDARPTPDAPTENLFLPMVEAPPAVPPVAGDVVPGQFIVVLKDAEVRAANSPDGEADPPEVVAAQVVNAFGGEVLYTYDSVLSGFAAELPDEAVAELEQNPDVAYVEPDTIVTIQDIQPNATWGLDRIDQRDRPLNGAYEYGVNGSGVHAYIIDTGILGSHQEFSGRMGDGYTAIFDGKETTDCNGHGTHVAGTVGGSTYGVAKQVTLHPVRVLNCNGSGTTSGVIAGVNWVRNHSSRPAVANMSLGGGASSSLDTAVRNAISGGVTFALAAGNENQNACNTSPARTLEAITVGATTSGDARSSFSNYGTCVDIFAPGSGITSAYYSSNSATATLNGTSMASPHVAGAAALYLAVQPNASPAQVAEALTSNASPNKLSSIGSGSPNLLLFTGFLNGAPPAPTATATATGTNTPLPTPTFTSTPTRTPTATPTATKTPPPGQTPTPTRTPVPTATPTTAPACTNRLTNGNFDQGRTIWAESSTGGYPLICTGTSCGSSITPRSASYMAWLGGANSETAEVRQTVTLPAGQQSYLSFYRQLLSNDYCGYDYAYVQVISGGFVRTLKRYSLCASAETAAWSGAQFDISSYAGQTITLVFRVRTDSSYSSSMFVDDVAVTSSMSCNAGLATLDTVDDLPLESDTGVIGAAAKPDLPAGGTDMTR